MRHASKMGNFILTAFYTRVQNFANRENQLIRLRPLKTAVKF